MADINLKTQQVFCRTARQSPGEGQPNLVAQAYYWRLDWSLVRHMCFPLYFRFLAKHCIVQI